MNQENVVIYRPVKKPRPKPDNTGTATFPAGK